MSTFNKEKGARQPNCLILIVGLLEQLENLTSIKCIQEMKRIEPYFCYDRNNV